MSWKSKVGWVLVVFGILATLGNLRFFNPSHPALSISFMLGPMLIFILPGYLLIKKGKAQPPETE